MTGNTFAVLGLGAVITGALIGGVSVIESRSHVAKAPLWDLEAAPRCWLEGLDYREVVCGDPNLKPTDSPPFTFPISFASDIQRAAYETNQGAPTLVTRPRTDNVTHRQVGTTFCVKFTSKSFCWDD